MKLSDYAQTGDWKGEKHVPVIDGPEKVAAGEAFKVEVCVGKEIPHPNEVKHYIKWIRLFFVPDGAKFAEELATFTFDTHGDSVDPETQPPSFADPFASVRVKLTKSGTLIAQSYCNIHGLWESSKNISVA